jgi:DNA-binding transcriptional MerR regulator
MFTLASMTGLRVSELAARAGVNASTVRFYERAGLLPAARRAGNGYRVFDDSAIEDLALIGRAKSIGMSLGEITSVVTAWRGSSGSSCQDAHALLREHLAARTVRLNDQMAELAASRQQAQSAFGRLTAREPGSGRCHADCACAGALAPAPDDVSSRPDGCTLDDDELACRVGEWRALATTALSAERDGAVLRLTLEPAMIPAAAALIAAEATCCPDARFTLEVTAGRAFLTAEFPC